MAEQVTAAEAHACKATGWKHLDVRTAEEFARLRVPDSVNVAYIDKKWILPWVNSNFVAEVAEHFPKDSRLVVSCATGKRSAWASAALAYAGYTVVNVEGGINSWRMNPGLPTESGAPSS